MGDTSLAIYERKDIAVNDAGNILLRLESIMQELPCLSSAEAVKRLIDQADAMRFLTRKLHYDQDIQNAAAEASLWTKRRLGELLPKPLPRNEAASIGSVPMLKPTFTNVTMENGIEPRDAGRCIQLAAVPEQEFREHIELVKLDGELSTAAVIRSVEAGTRMKPKTGREGNSYVPQGYDGCQTPAYALEPLFPYIEQSAVIWEPARGEGLLAETLYDARFANVLTSDLLTGENFFEYEPSQKWDVLITNPPYSVKYEWLERCYALGKPFALLVPVETLGAKTAQILMQKHGFEIMLLDQRVDFKMPFKEWDGSAQFPVMWLCWNILPQPVMFGSIEEAKRKFKLM